MEAARQEQRCPCAASNSVWLQQTMDEGIVRMASTAPMIREAASIIVANAHNPSILNHEWLKANGILPTKQGVEWELDQPPIATPPMSLLRYQNGTHIDLTSSHLVVRVSMQDDVREAESIAMSITANYVKTLKHIPYSGVGNNFSAMFECPDADKKIIDSFGNEGRHMDGVIGLFVKLAYRLPDSCQRNVEVSGATVQKSDGGSVESVQVVSIGANYHRNAPNTEAASQAIAKMKADKEDFIKFYDAFREDLCA